MAVALDSNKTKIARRVIEVFEFFASEQRRATVMDIVRRYDRPQSSTSELLGALVEMGLLYKDPQSRSYAPTPRLAAFGCASQPEPIASGRLFAYMDRLAQTARSGVGRPQYLEVAALLTLMPLWSPQGWDYVLLGATPAVMLLVDRLPELPRPSRIVLWSALLTMGLTVFDLMGRRAYARFMAMSVITLCASAVVAGLARLRFMRSA